MTKMTKKKTKKAKRCFCGQKLIQAFGLHLCPIHQEYWRKEKNDESDM
jgi:hypothetical protein